MKNFIFLFCLLLLCAIAVCQSPFKLISLSKSQLPGGVRFKGKVEQALKWTDKLGENILIMATFGPYKDENKDMPGEEAKTIELFSFHFIKKDTGWKLLWKITDAEKACAFDITAEFLKAGTRVTDLDNDGIAETTIQYKLSCRSDVSPAYMKVIMHEGESKYT